MTSLSVESVDNTINRTKLKEDLISLIPGLREDKPVEQLYLVWSSMLVGSFICDACEYNDLSDRICIATKGLV